MITNDRHRPALTAARASAMAAVLVLTLAASAPASPQDAWITAKVKLALLTTEGTDPIAVNVDTVDRKVTLHGTIHSAADKDRAEKVALGIEGAASVRNLLQVVARSREAAVERADQEVSASVEAALKEETSLKDSSIKVQSVNKGVVLLGGSAANLADHLTAVRVALGTSGVRRVASGIESPDGTADANIWKDGALSAANGSPVKAEPENGVAAEAKDAAEAAKDTAKDAARATRDTVREVGDAAGDMYITSKVKLGLLADEKAPALDINVDTSDGAVTLFGIVPSRDAANAAVADARSVKGVVSVKDELEIVPTAHKPVVEANDDVIQSKLEENLEERPELKDVEVEVRNCVARLTGSVTSGFERVEALQVARATRGVCSVRDELTLPD